MESKIIMNEKEKILKEIADKFERLKYLSANNRRDIINKDIKKLIKLNLEKII